MAEIHHSLVIDGPTALPEPEHLIMSVTSPKAELKKSKFLNIAGIEIPYSLLLGKGALAGLSHGIDVTAKVIADEKDYPTTTSTFLGLTKETTTTIKPLGMIRKMVTTTPPFIRESFMEEYDRESLDGGLWGYSSIYENGRWEERKRIMEEMDRGVMPRMGNGFSFVIDRLPDDIVALERPEVHDYKGFEIFRKAQSVPAQKYTRYFSERKIPIADADHYMRIHDTGHVPSYIDMFADPTFADLVVTAATNALPVLKDSRKFARSMDSYGDSMRNLMEHGHTYDVLGAQNNLSKLVQLVEPNPDNDDDIQARNETLFRQIWDSQGLARYEARARQVRANNNRIFEKIEFIPESKNLVH